MKTIDKIFGGVVIGFIVPITIICMFWWVSYLAGFNPVNGMLTGLVLGIFADMVLIRRLVGGFYSYSTAVLVAMFLLYSIGIFGFFMGVPVFNILTGILAAFYIGRRMRLSGADIESFKTNLKRTNVFSTLILVAICMCSAYIAIMDPYTGANLKGMFKLDFEITKMMLWSLILLGGAALAAAQYIISIAAGRFAYGMINKKA